QYMIKLGDYCEDDASEIVSYLAKSGIKSDTRPILGMVQYRVYNLEGKLSELKGVAKDFDKLERCVEVLRSVLEKKPSKEEFKDLFFGEFDPLMNEREEEFAGILQKASGDPKALTEEDKSRISDAVEKVREVDLYYDAALLVMMRNKVGFGEDVGGRLDDPIVRVMVKPGDYEKDHPMIRTTAFMDLSKRIEIFIDEISAGDWHGPADEFGKKYPAEYNQALAIGKVIQGLIKGPESRKADMSEFAEECMQEMEDEGNMLVVDLKIGAGHLVRELEKRGVVKAKGNIIKWKH
ncbi:MAG TPA: hypothetical protein VN455_03100, partial [Methanotrichaceae archaeon]|nr:hypothetical protein [Methanotrichaceae archaeon]